MTKELIIRSGASDVDFALLKNGRLVELHKEEDTNRLSVGDIMLAKIHKPIQGLNAAFVNVGYEKDAFLHYHDLGPQLSSLLKFIKEVSSGKIKDYSLKDFKLEPDINKNGAISEVLKAGQPILVQIVKEPISTKGPRISSELSIAGRYLVLVPFSERISISQKIENKAEKERLRRIVQSIKPKGFGVIIRTVAQDKKVADLDRDLQNSYERWIQMCKKIPQGSFPSKILSEMNRTGALLRDMFDNTFTGIHVDNEALYTQIRDYLQEIAPEQVNIVKLYKSSVPIFEKFHIERQIKTGLGRTVSMTKGAYLVIEHTEALHVIDVNSGNHSNKAENQETTAFEVNLIAATEIARQLRLRDMGGIIVVDFIDMSSGENRQKLFDALREEMKDDRAKHKILPPSKFGLIQITRQRVRPEINIKTKEENPSKQGEVDAPIMLIDRITTDLEEIIFQSNYNGRITLNIHPFIAAYLTKGLFSIRLKWFLKYRKWIKILPRDAYSYLEYRFKTNEGTPL
ncbi:MULTISPECIES: Rne/Rng family ribonuclease [Capnocytophaga]|mgnify:FL=1|jgi:ribonuclease, rne/rng family|uniref:Ribonuclease G n=1 Tax=Capnocytophaga granulosa TaxID=45242 RepID=A0A1H2WLW5_9FLAO|nr:MULTISPECIES: ribonuclease E/G [Capnocytophaga]RKW14153.1 MAG: ribonuclease E/G [Capnocytophaga sp.]EJU34595.1 ribonuclease E/G family protein [Capnocytophaga sp. CM59]EPD28100.1 rne/Rng family ribonuclease [Capnocytophaga granulosa ATCC 51502]SDW81466.1 ribonuclease G [Capnocytophaga granulosa]SUX19381.1 Ribonuclease G [Capnocytophaga granulosa]